MSTVGYDGRSITIDGRNELLISGAIHYPRSTPAMWPELFDQSRRAGLNTVETYVFWNLHERQRGTYDFSDRLDLPRFCRLAQAAGLHVILRIGPYVCAETNFGGFPSWLRDLPGIALRTDNEPFKSEMARWMRHLCERLAPFFAPAGGPIILAQIENEYDNVAQLHGEAGTRYLDWCVQLAESLKLGIPWIMCVGGAAGVLETINDFYPHRRIEAHRRKHPEQPLLCTEAWPGWYDVWGYRRNQRSATDVAYATARFFAAGGAGINYYMWHGGTNFGRESMYLQTTAYDFGGPLDEYGHATTKSRHLARLHRLLGEHASALLVEPAPAPTILGEGCFLFAYSRSLQFLCNDSSELRTLEVAGKWRSLEPLSVQVLDRAGELLFDSAAVEGDCIVTRRMEALPTRLEVVGHIPEPMPAQREDGGVQSAGPIEQLSLTADQSDYCWYSSWIDGGEGELVLDGVGDFVRVFVDGRAVATTPTPLPEHRTLKDNAGFTQRFALSLKPGQRRLDILCCALGMIKGEWMLGFANIADERKGIWGQITWKSAVVRDWTMRPKLWGELTRVDDRPASHWSAIAREGPGWSKWTFPHPRVSGPLVVQLSGFEKGLFWLNGRSIGRFWSIPCTAQNPVAPPTPVFQADDQTPPHQYYHLPTEWLEERNELVLFDEAASESAVPVLCGVRYASGEDAP